MTDQRLRDLERDAAHGDLQAQARLLLERVRVGDLTEEGVEFVIRAGPLVLFDSALSGPEAGSVPATFEERLLALWIPCDPGVFSIRTHEVAVEGGSALLHRFSRHAEGVSRSP